MHERESALLIATAIERAGTAITAALLSIASAIERGNTDVASKVKSDMILQAYYDAKDQR